MDLSTLGGYDYKFLVEERIVTTYHCLICRLVAKDVHQLGCCGKLICKDCLEEHRQRCGDTCPHCRNKISCFPDTRSCQEILSMKVECRNIVHGCTKSGELKMMIAHHKSCSFEVCICNACKQHVPKAKFKDHAQKECSRRNFQCPYCNTFGVYEDIINDHYKRCPKFPVKCLKCGLEMVREKLECHNCPKELVPCPYPTCSIKVTREELLKHKEDCPMKHGATNPTAGQLSSEAEDQYTLPLMFGITVSGSDDTPWVSPGFYTHSKGYRMCLKVYFGSYSGQEEYLSCFLHLMSGRYDDQLKWPFRAQFEVVLMNQQDDTEYWNKEINFYTCSLSPCNSRVQNGTFISELGIGDPQYIERCQLEEASEYLLKNDKVVFSIKCRAMPHFGGHCQAMWLANHDIPHFCSGAL